MQPAAAQDCRIGGAAVCRVVDKTELRIAGLSGLVVGLNASMLSLFCKKECKLGPLYFHIPLSRVFFTTVSAFRSLLFQISRSLLKMD